MRRILGLLLCLASACSGACSGSDGKKQPTTPPPAGGDAGSGSAVVVAPPPDPTKPAPLSESMAAPYFATGDAADGAAAFALEKWADAAAAFEKARATATPDLAARLDLMTGLAYAKAGEWPKAADKLAAAQPGLPQIADYVKYHLAQALYFAHRPGALDLAKTVDRDSIVGWEGELLVGDLLRDAGDAAKVAEHYGDYLKRRPDGPRRSEARYYFAEANEKVGDAKESITLYRRIWIDDPLSSWATKAKARLTAINAKDWDKLTAAEHIAQGMELFDAMRNPESEAAFDDALKDPKISAEDKCIAAYHKAQSRFKARDRKGAAPMFDDAIAACHAAKNVDLEVKSNYVAGKSYSYINQHDVAIARYRASAAVDPKHSYADDALLREGEEWAYKNDGKQVEVALSALPTKYPDGDNIAEAMWRLGFRAWRDKKYDDAIKWWNKQIELVPHDDNWYGEGQAQYWIGRAYVAKGQPKEALASYEKAVKEYPAAYYALLAFNRIRELDPKRYEALAAEIAADPKDFDPKAPAFTFKPRLEWASPGFQRAVEFLRLGLGDACEAELKKVKLTAPSNRKRVDDPDQLDKLWAIAYLYDRAGRYQQSHWPTRWHMLDYRRSWPVGANRARWLIGYPKAYGALLARYADINKVPFNMLMSIVREESAFDPLLESYANAVGLTQMIPPTAHDFAKGTGIDPTRENLRDPEKNVTIGTRFLASLYKRWNSFTLLVPPSYNAGPAGVGRMLKVRGTWDCDEFVEGIVDDQARNYTKRVLGTFFTYSWLYDKTIPEIPNTIPKALLPK
jgi:peptidoglycan lytic transglycosylase